MARMIRSYMPADFEFLAGGMDARIEDSTPDAKTGIPLKELWRDSFYPTTPVERDVQAVVVPFSQGASVDVVPAVFDQMLNGKLPLYLIPDGDRDWMPTCPELHANYIRQADAKSGGKLKRVAQLLKYWRECRSP